MSEKTQTDVIMCLICKRTWKLGELPCNCTHNKHDSVNHPSHYTSDPSGVECIQITRHRNFNIGNAIKYLWRAGLKDKVTVGTGEFAVQSVNTQKQIEDLRKARWYIADEIKRLGGTVE